MEKSQICFTFLFILKIDELLFLSFDSQQHFLSTLDCISALQLQPQGIALLTEKGSQTKLQGTCMNNTNSIPLHLVRIYFPLLF